MAKRDKPTEREMKIHCAKVYLAEARNRSGDRGFQATLMRWAGNKRREAMALPKQKALV